MWMPSNGLPGRRTRRWWSSVPRSKARSRPLEWRRRTEFREAVGLKESGLNKLIRSAYYILGLRTFFTTGDDENRAWTFKAGMKAPQTAGLIHSDFQKGFIKAEIYSCDDLFAYGSEQKLRVAGKLRLEGKEYLVRDGDVIHFKFNV